MRGNARLEVPIATQSPHPLRIMKKPLRRHHRPPVLRLERLFARPSRRLHQFPNVMQRRQLAVVIAVAVGS